MPLKAVLRAHSLFQSSYPSLRVSLVIQQWCGLSLWRMDRLAGSNPVWSLLRIWASWWRAQGGLSEDQAGSQVRVSSCLIQSENFTPASPMPTSPDGFIKDRNLREDGFLWALPQQPTTRVGLATNAANGIFRFLLGQSWSKVKNTLQTQMRVPGTKMSYHICKGILLDMVIFIS